MFTSESIATRTLRDHILRACPFMPPGQRLYLVGLLAFRRVPSRSTLRRLAACRTRYSRPLQLRFWRLARCERFAFPVAVEDRLHKCNHCVNWLVALV